MSKFYKIVIVAGIAIGGLLFAGWKVFNHYWRNQSTVNTFTDFAEEESLTPSKIKWVSGTFGNVETSISAFFVPVKLNGIDDSFYMQFDTGTPQTLLYGKALNTLKERYPTFSATQSESGNYWLNNAHLAIGSVRYKARRLLVQPNLGSKTLDSTFIVLGTIGYDAILGKKILLDFKDDLLFITERELFDLGYSFAQVDGASLDRFPILLPATVDGKKVQLEYDSGSSMFPLITDLDKLVDLENAGEIDTLCCLTQWGKSYEFYRRRLDSDIRIGGLSEMNPYVYGSKSMEQYAYFPDWLMMGFTGNQLFMDKAILIDSDNNYFGISN